MSLPSVAKEKSSNKVSLVPKPSVTLIQPVQVIGSSASQPTLIYVKSVQPSSEPAYVAKVNRSRPSSSQPITILSNQIQRPANKVVALPSTSTPRPILPAPNKQKTFQSKSSNAVTVGSQKRMIANQSVSNALNDKPTITKIIKTRISSPVPTPPAQNRSIEKYVPAETSNHKSTVDPIVYRYRSILENLLQLKNNFVRRTITQAIKQKLCNQSNEDLLNVIFKSFELTLLSVNVDQIYLNETYLTATLAFLAKVIETGRFMELIENRKETPDIRRFITAEMSSVLNKVSLESVYKNARQIFEQKQRGSYAQILELMIKAISCVKDPTEVRITTTEIEFWLKEVMPLVFDVDEDIQTNAIEAVAKATPLLLASQHNSHPIWDKLRAEIVSDYTKKISSCFRQGSPKWYQVWCLCVRLLDIDIPKSATTLNAFLSIVEPAMRSNVPLRRAEGYLCWRVLLEVLVRHNRLNSEKRLKLMCTPLRSLQAKTVEIATNKFQAWWYVLCNVNEGVTSYIAMVFEPFLQFCFGQLFPAPNLTLEPSESATQVKSFPDVSLMAVSTFLRILDDSDKQIDELFDKFSLIHPSHAVLTEAIFSINTTAALVINACGEATIMLNKLRNDANNNIDCITLSVCMWTRLFKHVNKAKKYQHINLILDNVSQLLQIKSIAKMLPMVCASIIGQINSSFIFECDENELSEEAVQTIVKLMDTIVLMPNMQSRFGDALMKLLAVPDIALFQTNFTHLFTEVHKQFFKNVKMTDESIDNKINKFIINCTVACVQANADKLRSNSQNVQIPHVFFDILYGPLLLPLNRQEFNLYTKELVSSIDLLLPLIDNSIFCKQSAKTVLDIITTLHCVHINETIATLFEYAVYEIDDFKDAPSELLDVCVLAINKKSKVLFQDLNSITEALIKYRRAISQKHFDIIAPKLREIVQLIDGEKVNMRLEPNLIQDLKDLVGSESTMASQKSTPTSKALRSKGNRPEDDEFVVVNKVWKLHPGKLTDHQKEKMKTRRCDIPALYNDLSQSQDSVSIQEWTPKAFAKPADVSKVVAVALKVSEDDKVASEPIEATGESPARAKKRDKGVKTSPKRQITNSVDGSNSKSESESPDESNAKRRKTRESARQSDDKTEEVPYTNAGENRLTRSTVKKTEDKPEIAAKRKTRSDSVRTPDVKEAKKKATRANNSPATKLKKVNAKLNNSDDVMGELTPKRRQTRHTKADEAEDESIKVDNKKTEIIDTLELKVEKLPDGSPAKMLKASENIEETNKLDSIKYDAAAMDVDEPMEEVKPIEEVKSILNVVDDIAKISKSGTEEVTENDQSDEKKCEVETKTKGEPLVETMTVPNGDEVITTPTQLEDNSLDTDSDVDLSSRSYMSALVFEGLSPSKSLNGSTIVTSPVIDVPRSLEFLNDTLNISPIAPEINAKKEGGTTTVQKKLNEDLEMETKPESNVPEKEDLDVKTDKPLDTDDAINAKESNGKKEIEDNKVSIVAPTPNIESPIVSSLKQSKATLAIQSSTPIQSHHSPVSSKFKPQLTGRGAQLLKMLNSHKSPKPASPTPLSNDAYARTATPSINQLETAPICENVVSTPEPKQRLAERHEQNENGNFLTLSGVLPSPYASPSISILKRKSSNISMDDSMHSPAPKRKRVSFGFPLSHTKEYIIDEDFTPFYMLPSNDSPCRRANRLKKLKLKRNQTHNQSDTAKAPESKPAPVEPNATLEPTSSKDDEVSVKHIQEYLGMDMQSYRAKQEKLAEDLAAAAPPPIENQVPKEKANAVLNSDDSSTESNDDDPENETPTAKSIKEFSDDVIFSHLLSKYSASDILKKLESSVDAKALTKRLSTLMSDDKQTETAVLEELAEKHSEPFLEHAITENLCSVICDRLMLKSSNGITEYITDKINSEDQFASDFLDRVSVSVLRQKLMDVTPEQYLQLTSIYIQRNPPAALETFD